MINSELQKNDFITLLKVRKHFSRLADNVPGQQFKYDTPEYKKLKTIIDDIDAIILEKYNEETNTDPLAQFFNYL